MIIYINDDWNVSALMRETMQVDQLFNFDCNYQLLIDIFISLHKKEYFILYILRYIFYFVFSI